jgi:hypothetical protein
MNERIKELWSQAGGQYNSGNQHTWPQYTIDDPEKFAELIVKECMEVVGDYYGQGKKSGPGYTMICEIKEHFGVEE